MGHRVTHPGHQSIKPAASHLRPFTNVLRLDTFSLVASFPSEFLRSTSRSAHRSDRALPTRVSGPLRGIIAGRPRCQLKGRLAPTLTAARCRGTPPQLRSAHRFSRPLDGFLRPATREFVSPHNHVQDSSEPEPRSRSKARPRLGPAGSTNATHWAVPDSQRLPLTWTHLVAQPLERALRRDEEPTDPARYRTNLRVTPTTGQSSS